MNEAELNILRYLEDSYVGARTMDDGECCVRIARAIAAFKADPCEDEYELFTEKFIEESITK